MTPEGAASEIRIDIHPGAYSPEFRYVAAHAEEHVAPVVTSMNKSTARTRRGMAVACTFAVLAASAVFAVPKFFGSNRNNELFLRFWGLVLRAPEPLLVAVAHPIVYHVSRRAQLLGEQYLPPQEGPSQRPVQLAANQMDGSDLVTVVNQYVGFGDMVATNEVSTMLARKSKSVRIRLASGIEFADLRKAPALLIGAVTNRWTTELQQACRFRFSRNPDLRTVIVDTQAPGQVWSIAAKEDGSSPEDYILVCRIRDSLTGGLTIVAAGLKQFGTEAAGRLLADPDQLGLILRKLHDGWETGNV